MGKLIEEIRALLKEVPEIDVTDVPAKSAPVVPIAAKQMLDLAQRVLGSWNKAYGSAEPLSGFVLIRHLGYDLLQTFDAYRTMSAKKSEPPDLRAAHENELAWDMHRMAARIKTDYEVEVIRRGNDLKAEATAIAEAADAAESLSDPALRPLVLAFADKFLPWRSMIGPHVYAPVNSIVRRAEEINNRFFPPDERPGKDKPSGKRDTYKGRALESSREVSDTARQFVHEMEMFRRLSEPTIGEIEKMAGYAEEVIKEIPPEAKNPTVAPEPDMPVAEARSVGRPSKRRKWMTIAWANDPEIPEYS
jgi:hypothetical protein